jgi:hypothetical protein
MMRVEIPSGEDSQQAWQLAARVTGEFICTRISDRDGYEVRIDKADDHVLVSEHYLREIIESPSDIAWLTTSEQRTVLVFDGCNRRVEYHLTRYHPLAAVWEARLLTPQ